MAQPAGAQEGRRSDHASPPGDVVHLRSTLQTLHDALASSSERELEGGFGAVLHPLRLLLASFATTRVGEGAASTDGSREGAARAVSVREAESVLACLLLVLERGAAPSEDQVAELWQLLLMTLALPAQLSSEEACLLAVKALAVLARSQGGTALQRDANVPLLGHSLSLLLQVADAQAAAGDRGSRALRAEAFLTLDVVLRQQSGQPDVLAFFLPGVSTGLCAAMRRAVALDQPGGSGPSSAGSSASAAVNALAALTTALRVTLGEESFNGNVAKSCSAIMQDVGAAGASDSSLDALLRLCRAGNVSAAADVAEPVPDEQQTERRMRVERTPAWMRTVTEKLNIMLPPLFVALKQHSRSSVRVAAATAASELLVSCGRTVTGCSQAWLECLLGLAHDPWPQVRSCAVAHLSRLQLGTVAITAPNEASVQWQHVEAVIARQLDAMEQTRGEHELVAACRLLAGSIALAGHVRFADTFLFSSLRRKVLCRKLVVAFSLSGRAQERIAPLAAEPLAWMAHDAATAALGTSRSLPGRHERLALLTTEESYTAGAEAVRLVGRAAAATSATALLAVTDELLHVLREVVCSAPSGWRLRAGSIVLVLSELLFGASSAWNDASSLNELSSDAWLLSDDAGRGGLMSAAQMVADEIIANRVFQADEVSPQQLRDARCLMASSIELIGVLARATRQAFITHPRMLPSVFATLLEMLGDSAPQISAAAAATLASIATHCDYSGSIRELVTAHSDYVIDALCRQLRHLESHPRAPFMFSALLRHCGVGSVLLPSLSEPLQISAAALSVLHRRQHASHGRTLLEILSVVAASAFAEAARRDDSESCDDLRRRMVSVSRLAAIAADAAAPLVLASDPRSTVLALDTMTDAVRTIALVDAMRADVTEDPAANRAPPPQLLPHVHMLWPFYSVAISSGHAVSARRALERLPELAAVSGGDFLRQRFAVELWPYVRQLIERGALRGQPTSDAAPGTLTRMQLAAITCVLELAQCAEARDALADAASDAADALASALLHAAQNSDVGANAERALHALSALDADAVWLTLFKAGRVSAPRYVATSLLLPCC